MSNETTCTQLIITPVQSKLGQFKTYCCGSCLGCLCLIPMAFLAGLLGADILGAVSGGLIVGVNDFLMILLGENAGISFLVNALLNILLILLFPLDWVLLYRPGNVLFAVSIIMPWVLCGTITALLFAKHAKEGFLLPLLAALYWLILFGVGAFLLNTFSGGIVDAAFMGLTDRGAVAAVVTACLEGGAIGGIFGALVGALKYDPDTYGEGGSSKKKKKRKGKSKSSGYPYASREGSRPRDSDLW